MGRGQAVLIQGSGDLGLPPACGIPALAESLMSFWPGEIFAYF